MNFGRSSLFHPECANRNIDVCVRETGIDGARIYTMKYT